MATIGHGYGSEWHLLRWFGYHRSRLNELIKKETKLDVVEWLDFGFKGRPDKGFPTLDSEIEHLNFLSEGHPAKADWLETWPVTNGALGRGPCWDGIAKLSDGGWLLVEAKAHLGELESPGSQASPKSLEKIEALLDGAKKAYGVSPEVPWTKKYYQQANRLAVLWFLNQKHSEKAHLLNICFTDDQFKDEKVKCPANKAGWADGIAEMKKALGLSDSPLLDETVKYLFLPVTKRGGDE